MIEVQTFDPIPFLVAAYGLVAVVVAALTVQSLLELRRWAKRVRALEADAAQKETRET